MVSSHRAVGKADPAYGRASGAALFPKRIGLVTYLDAAMIDATCIATMRFC